MDIQTFSKQMVAVLNTHIPEPDDQYDSEIVDSSAIDLHYLPHQASTVRGLVESVQPVPPYSTVFGTCEDGLPFLMDLKDPSPGAILISGDKQTGKSRLLRSMLTASSLINPSSKVNYCLITSKDREFYNLTNKPHCLAAASPYDRSASELLMEMSAITEQRRNGRHRGPVVILAIDDLAKIAHKRMDYDVFVHFKWLLEEGPKSHIWPIVTIDVQHIKKVDKRLLSAFGSLFFSNVQSPRLLEEITASYPPPANNLYPGYQFEFLYAGGWIKFTLPAVVE
jgi:hypothetical protein